MMHKSKHEVPPAIKIAAPAKLNLRLKVTGRRSDGYHLLSMLNVCLDFQDELRIEAASGSAVELAVEHSGDFAGCAALGSPQENLVYRAAELFKLRFAPDLGCKITLFKKIPIGAGLGGGSSDAAATLVGLAVLIALFHPQQASEEDLALLAPLAAQLGADVPYFLRGGMCRVEGVGDKVRPILIPFLERLPCLLVVPDLHSSTPEVYAELRRTNPSDTFVPDLPLESFCGQLRSNPAPAYAEFLELIENDLCQAAFNLHPSLRELHLSLTRFAGFACGMSGSGSAFFLVPRTPRAISSAEYSNLKNLLKNSPNKVILSTFLPNNTTRVECVTKGSA